MTAEEWRNRRVGEFATRSKIINLDGALLPPLSITKGRGVVLQSEKYKKQIATDLRKYVIARRDQFAFDPMSLYYGAIGQVESIDIGVVSPDYVVFDVDDTVDKTFLNFLLRSPEQVAVYETVAETGNSFGKRRRVYWSVLEQLELRLPPLAEQRKIATILSSVDDAIEASQAVNDQLQVVKKAMLAELLTCGLPGRHTRFKPTELGQMPDCWEFTTLGALCAATGLQTGPFGSQLKASDYVSSGVPVVMPRDIVDQRITTTTIARINDERAEELSRHRLQVGDIVFGRRGDIGRCALVRVAEAGWLCGTGCLRARLERGVNPEFLVRWLGSEPVKDWLVARAVGQTMLNLNTEILSRTPVGLPSLQEQEEIAAAVESIEQRLVAESEARDAYRFVRAALMSVLLSGEVRVTLDEGAA